jgi:ABC-2 type transport system ATP-binding protein
VADGGSVVNLVLPAVFHRFDQGHRLRVVICSTDQAFSVPLRPRQYTVELGDAGRLTVPLVATSPQVVGSAGTGVLAWGATGLVVLLLGLAWWWTGRRPKARPVAGGDATLPVRIHGLGKRYGDGFQAVTDLSFDVRPGWVLGLLGPNGAGKTTTLRMLMGLIKPSAGGIEVFGQVVAPGAPVLGRVGCFIEGPGFLPHLSGLANLELYWRATGLPAARAQLDEALRIAGLGQDVHRKVRTYSQGMRQRLAIAQAMLGLPDLLILDEPTNGLDPPQIRQMRQVLRDYAETGRTVVVSSHLLAEVEQTCTHVVVMHHGRLVASGPVAELVAASSTVNLVVEDPEAAAKVLADLSGVEILHRQDRQLILALTGIDRAELVRALVRADIAIDQVAPQRGLEEAFLNLVALEDANER